MEKNSLKETIDPETFLREIGIYSVATQDFTVFFHDYFTYYEGLISIYFRLNKDVIYICSPKNLGKFKACKQFKPVRPYPLIPRNDRFRTPNI